MRPHGRQGFSLVELAISIVLLALIMGSVGLVGLSNRRAFDQGVASADLDAQLRRTTDRVVQEFMRSGASVLIPDPVEDTGASDVTYLKATGVSGGATTWSTPFRIYWDYELGELDDGLDNNGNGLIDEGRVIWVRNVGTSDDTLVLCHGVREYLEGETANNADDNGNVLEDERGFCLERTEDSLVIRLTLEHIAESGLQTKTIETSVKLRN